MKSKNIGKAVLKVLSLAAILPILASAQGALPTPKVDTYPKLIALITEAAKWLFGILLVATVVFLIYAAFLYLTAGGDEEKTKKAKSYIIYAVIALAVGILAQSIVSLVGNFLGYQVPA